MVQSGEESVLLLIKEETKFATAKRMTKLYTILDSIGYKGYDVPEGENVIDMISSGEYKFDYLIVSLDYELLNESILKCKQYFPKIAILISYDKNTNLVEEKLSYLDKTYGIKCFLEKVTLTLQNLTTAFKKLKTDLVLKRESDQRYNFIQNINAGSMGIVDLYVDNQIKRLIAIKRIPIEGMNKEAKAKVMREVDLMKSIKVPTVIEFYDSTFDNDFRYIYMEFADGGTLEDKISQCKIKGQTLEPQQILDWIIEIAIALFVMNKHKMMHRDLKCENILLHSEKEGEKVLGVAAKLSDLGISRTKSEGAEDMTICGTPYYVSPEIASDLKHYDFNTDIWSLGVVLYEIATFKKPFGDPSDTAKFSNNINSINNQTLSMGDLYEIIRSQPYPKLPKHIDSRIKFLIKVMLQKNPKLRWNLKDLFEVDFFIERAMQLIKQFKWEKQIPYIEELHNFEKNKKTPAFLIEVLKEEDTNLLEDVNKILNLVTYSPYKKSFFSGKVENAITGTCLIDSFTEIKEHLQTISPHNNANGETEENSELENFFSCLIDKEILVPLSHQDLNPTTQLKNLIENSDSSYFTISIDILTCANPNVFKNIKLNSNVDLLTLSQFILKLGKKMIKKINLESAIEEVLFSTEHLNFLVGIQTFRQFDVLSLEYTEGCRDRLAFMLNLYQIMLIHYLLISLDGKNEKKGNTIVYQFKDFSLTNSEIKHVIFRANKKPPGSYFRLVYNTDPKTSILPLFDDSRVLFLLFDFEEEVFNLLRFFRVNIFETKTLAESLNKLTLNFLYKNTTIEESENLIIFPTYIENYLSDFNETDTKDIPHHLLKILYETFHKNTSKETPQIYKIKLDDAKTKSIESVFGSLTVLLRKIQNRSWKVIYAGK